MAQKSASPAENDVTMEEGGEQIASAGAGANGSASSSASGGSTGTGKRGGKPKEGKDAKEEEPSAEATQAIGETTERKKVMKVPFCFVIEFARQRTAATAAQRAGSYDEEVPTLLQRCKRVIPMAVRRAKFFWILCWNSAARIWTRTASPLRNTK